MRALSNAGFLETKDNRGLINPFTGEKAQDDKYRHLMSFRQIGEEEYKLRISYFIQVLKHPTGRDPCKPLAPKNPPKEGYHNWKGIKNWCSQQ